MSHRAGPPWGATHTSPAINLLRDLPIILAGLALFAGLLSLTQYWSGPMNGQVEIDLHPSALPGYAFLSLARIGLAYIVSLLVTFVYGRVAAYNPRAERFLIPLLDTLQSIPVLSFLPGVMLGMMALFPKHQLGVELGAILLIFTGQAWNMIFSFYSSLKSIPKEMLEVAQVSRMSWWQKFTQLELPYSTIGLVWNSMMSVAGAWFFLMVCEMFTLKNRDLRLPGLGSYLQTAANMGDTRAIVWGVTTMIAVIVLLDQLLWRPVIAWSEKFKFEQVESAQVPRSPLLEWLRRSRLLSRAARVTTAPAEEAITLHFARRRMTDHVRVPARLWLSYTLLVAMAGGVLYAIVLMFRTLFHLKGGDVHGILLGAAATFVRVEAVLLMAALWTIPVGVYIGLRPKLAAYAQPIAQIAASVPATALFPIILLVLIRIGGGLGIGAIVLLMLGTQWYILFNVIAGAMAIPSDLKEVCQLYRVGTFERWRRLLLPGIFPYLVTGLVTASGGAWNASIVAEYFRFKGQTYTTVGLGAVISSATDAGNYPLLLGATAMMAIMVVTMNRLLWRRLYALAGTRYRLE